MRRTCAIAALEQRLALSPYSCNSFIVVECSTGRAVCEIYDIDLAAAVNIDRYDLRTAYEHLAAINSGDALAEAARPQPCIKPSYASLPLFRFIEMTEGR